MFKGERKYYWILGTLFLGIVILQYMQPKPVDWSRTYMAKDKSPFGCYAVYNLVRENFAGEVLMNKQTLYEMDKKEANGDMSLLLVNNRLSMKELDVKSLFDIAKRGNTVLLSALEFAGHLKDTFKLETEYQWYLSSTHFDSLLLRPRFKVHFVSPKVTPTKEYMYNEAAIRSYFTSFDTMQFKVVAVDEHKEPVLIARPVGKGMIYFSSTPDVFTNVLLVKNPSRFYAYGLLSLLKNKTLMWDEHYKTFNVQDESMFRFIFNNDALYTAYCLLLVSLVVFMFFSARREQRPVPVVTPLTNSTLEFVNVITNVYFNSGNHLSVAFEKINYFYFDLRERFRVNPSERDDKFFEMLSGLSGIEERELKGLFSYLENLKNSNSLTEYDLIELNKRITEFNKKSIR